MIVRIMSDLAKSIVNAVMVCCVVGFLVAGGIVIRIVRGRSK